MRSNDSANQEINQMRETVRVLAQKMNLLERMLDGKELRESKVESGEVYQRTLRLSLNNGLVATDWRKTDLTANAIVNADLLIELSAYYEFGIYSITADVVRVNAGELQDSLLAAKTASAADITIDPAGTTYIFVEYIYGGAVEIKGSTARPVMDATTYRRILHWWTLVDGVATLSKISHIGNIVIPGTFATQG